VFNNQVEIDMTLAIVGTGYIGRVTGACLSAIAHSAACVDVYQHRISGLEKGIIPILKPGMEAMIVENTSQYRLFFTPSLSKAMEKEGAAIDDFMRPDRIAVGSESDHAARVMREVYEPLARNESQLLTMQARKWMRSPWLPSEAGSGQMISS
jgi:UDP-glucose 6-dehydrogenase